VKRPIAPLLLALLLPAAAIPLACKRGGPERPAVDDSVQPVYPLDISAAPIAQKLCDALDELPAKRRAECCGGMPGRTVTSECVRMLSGALSFRAVTLEPKAVDRCAADLAARYDGCDWVGPSSMSLPASCEGLVHGVLAAGTRCRSSLECADGLRCQGVGPTDAGVCAKPAPEGAPCDTAVDALAGYALQNPWLDHERPECAGACVRHRCQAPIALGGSCESDEPCGAGNRCSNRSCTAGSFAQAGEACTGASCAGGARCVAGTCRVPAPEGTACSADAECKGACVSGKCAKRC
jgi:hypothetical protein